MSDLASLAPAYPELVLAVGAMALLMFGVFRPATPATGEISIWLAIVLLIGSTSLLMFQTPDTVTLFEGAFIVDQFARFMKLLILAGSGVSLLMSIDFLRRAQLLQFEYAVLILLATLGMLMMVSANDLIALYLGLELQSLALYVIAAFHRDHVRSSEAGLKYFVLGALSSGLLLYGASLVYGFTGTTSFAAIASVTQSTGAGQNIGLVVGLVFVLVGLAFKVSAVPFHMWTPDVYEGAPTPITSLFAAAAKMAAVALLVRVVATAFPGIVVQWQQVVVFLAIASMLLGAFAAIGQANIKRLMAYSSIGHVGFALVGLAAGGLEGLQGVLIYLAIYMIMTLGAFACILAMRRNDEMVEDITQLSGLARTNLPMAVMLGILLFSMAGIPPLAGFFAKFYVFSAAIKQELYSLAVIGVIASVVGAYYYLRIVKIMFFDEPTEAFSTVDIKTGLVMMAAGVSMVVFIALPGPLIDAATAAARSLRP